GVLGDGLGIVGGADGGADVVIELGGENEAVAEDADINNLPAGQLGNQRRRTGGRGGSGRGRGVQGDGRQDAPGGGGYRQRCDSRVDSYRAPAAPVLQEVFLVPTMPASCCGASCVHIQLWRRLPIRGESLIAGGRMSKSRRGRG